MSKAAIPFATNTRLSGPMPSKADEGALAGTPSAPLIGLPKIQGSCTRNLDLPKLLPTAVVVAFTLMIWFVIPPPAGVSLNAWHLFALFVGTIVGIISNAMPLGAMSIIAIALVAVTGVTNPGKPAAAVVDALSGFANPLIWLIVIAVMVAMAVLKTGLGRRIGYYFVMLMGERTIGVAYGLVLSELVIAPVTPSNTARGGAIIHPIMRSIADSYGSSPEKGTSRKISRFLALVNYNSIQITWGQWALAALLPCLCMLLVMPLVLYMLYPPEIKQTPGARELARAELAKLGPMRAPEKITLGVLALMLAIWADLPAWLLGPVFGVDPTTTAVIGLSLLLITGVLGWEDVLKARSAWDTLIWFAALVMMATFLGSLGLTKWFSVSIQGSITHLGLTWQASAAILVLIYFYAHYFFASTTAHVTAMFTAFFAAGIALGTPPMLLGLLLAFSSSLMMSLTHYATGTAPIIFGSGYATLNEWWIAGAVMSAVNLLLLVLVGSIWWTMLGYIANG